ncbi:hypothetical protein D3C80_1933930 [compost metagenome]
MLVAPISSGWSVIRMHKRFSPILVKTAFWCARLKNGRKTCVSDYLDGRKNGKDFVMP